MTGTITLALALAMTAAGTASAQDADDADKYTFFNQPGLARDVVIADWEDCRDLASAVQPPPAGYAYTPNMAAAATTGFIQGMIRGAQRRHMFDAALRKCMQVKGYARYAMPKEEAKSLYSGPWSVLREKLTDRALGDPAGARRLDP